VVGWFLACRTCGYREKTTFNTKQRENQRERVSLSASFPSQKHSPSVNSGLPRPTVARRNSGQMGVAMGADRLKELELGLMIFLVASLCGVLGTELPQPTQIPQKTQDKRGKKSEGTVHLARCPLSLDLVWGHFLQVPLTRSTSMAVLPPSPSGCFSLRTLFLVLSCPGDSLNYTCKPAWRDLTAAEAHWYLLVSKSLHFKSSAFGNMLNAEITSELQCFKWL
jgi:hypothetical protein